MKKIIVLASCVVLLASLPATVGAFPACDSYGQDWNLIFGAFGGTFPGTALVSGCRDCNSSLGCTKALPLAGAVTATPGLRGALYVFSMTAFDDSADADTCVATHWDGQLATGTTVSGQVSNEFGPFGSFTLALGVACPSAPEGAGADPARRN
jgi:hypothetical protein